MKKTIKLLMMLFFVQIAMVQANGTEEEVIRINAGETYEFSCKADEKLYYREYGDYEGMHYEYFASAYVSNSRNSGYKPIGSGERFVVHVLNGYVEFYAMDWSSFDVSILNRPALVTEDVEQNQSATFTNHTDSRFKLNIYRLSETASMVRTLVDKNGVTDVGDEESLSSSLWFNLDPGETCTVQVTSGSIKIFGDYETYTSGYTRGADVIAENLAILDIIDPTYLYDNVDPGDSIMFDNNQFDNIGNAIQAVSAITQEVNKLSTEQKTSMTGIDLMTLYAEESIYQVVTQTENESNILIDGQSISSLMPTYDSTKTMVRSTLSNLGITSLRELNSGIKFSMRDTEVSVAIDDTAYDMELDNYKVSTDEAEIVLTKALILSGTADGQLVIDVDDLTAAEVARSMIADQTFAMMQTYLVNDGALATLLEDIESSGTKAYRININKEIDENLKVALPKIEGDEKHQTVYDSDGQVYPGKYNPVTDKVEFRTKTSGTYYVVEKRKNFNDIANKSAEMRRAIEVLSSKGIINGTSATTFDPDAPLTRAQIAQLLTKTLSLYNKYEDGGFSDVNSNQWYYGAAGSAKKAGLMNGVSATSFAPNVNIPKDQIIVVTARVLKTRMGYLEPTNLDLYLNAYVDKSAFAGWSVKEIALASREGLIISRSDRKFVPNQEMTRGDVAIILHRLFKKIW